LSRCAARARLLSSATARKVASSAWFIGGNSDFSN
jgi:hypothetical protein